MEFRKSIPKTLGLLCLSILMIVVSYFAATHSNGYKMVISWFGVPFFALAFVSGCVQLVRGGPSILMNAEGVGGRRVGSALKWSDVAAVSVGRIKRQQFLCLWLRNEDGYVAQLAPARRLAAKAIAARGFPAVSLSFTGLTPGLPEALEYALKYVPRKADH